MNAAHIHLLLNHIPILGALFGMILLIFGLIRKNNALSQAALITFIMAAIVTLPVDWSGEQAEEIVEELPGISHDLIHEHEEIAELAVKFMLGLGVLSLLTLILGAWHVKIGRILRWITLLLSFAVFFLMTRAGNSGGEISHPEIRKDFKIEKATETKDSEEKDDD